MIITNFDSFNEGFLGIDLKKIKEEAQNFAKSKDCVRLFSQVDTDILDSVVEELKKLKEKWGSLDDLALKLFAKVEAKNEGVGSVIILSAFGIHAFMKLLAALKNGWGFKKYLSRLFWSRGDYDFGRTLRDIAIMIVFLGYVVSYLVSNKVFVSDYYKTSTGIYTDIAYKWDGIHDYILQDGFGKEYEVKRIKAGEYDILYKGKKIGTTDCDAFYRLDGKKIADGVIFSKNDDVPAMTKLDLEKILTGKYNKSTEKEIDIRQKEIDKLEREIDSLNQKAYENVDLAKKIFKEAGKDYDKIVNTTKDQMHNLDIEDRDFLYIKNLLTKNNNIGYLGLFANLSINDKASGSELESIYNKIISNKDILNNLRGNNGELCQLFNFTKYEDLDDALDRLKSWRKVNQFMRELPSAQKRLIWENGYFTDDLKDKSQFLISAITKIANDANLSRTFLSKISAAKTKSAIIDSIASITNQELWDFDHWLNKLNNTRNVYVTWSSKEEKQIICIATSYQTIKNIAYMTNWCITRDKYYFDSYSKNGFQCILYDFNYPITSNDSVIGFSLNSKKKRYEITNCHNKSDHSTRLPEKFINMKRENRGYGYYSTKIFIKPEYVKVNLAKAALKFDKTFIKALSDQIVKPIRTTLNKPGIAKFIDFYDSDD